MTERRSLPQRLALLLVPTLALAACATSAQAPAAPSAAPAGQTPATAAPAREADKEEPGDFAGQLALLNKAETQLNLAISGRKETAAKQPAGTGASPGKAPQTNPPRPGIKSGEEDQSGDPCATACTALASMTRATTHLCGLTGEGDSRCEDARTRVRSATDRVRASCPACAAD